MRPLPRKGVPLPPFGVRKKLLPRKDSKPLELLRPAEVKPDAEKIFIKEEKKIYETKEEKYVPISKLRDLVVKLSNEQLKAIIATDERSTAKELANKELKKREG
jgi:hypothetical protein